MASDISLRTILIVRKETRCRHIGYSYRLTARVLLYAPSHRQDNTYHGLCYTSRGALAGTRNSTMGPPHEGSIRWPIAPRNSAEPWRHYLDLGQYSERWQVQLFDWSWWLPNPWCFVHPMVLSPGHKHLRNDHLFFAWPVFCHPPSKREGERKKEKGEMDRERRVRSERAR